MKSLPPDAQIEVQARDVAASEATLARVDAAIFVLERPARETALRGLPHAPLWSALHRAQRGADPNGTLVARLPNARHTLVVVGFVEPQASAFQRLEVGDKGAGCGDIGFGLVVIAPVHGIIGPLE